MKRELMLGCGNRKEKRIWLHDGEQACENLTTLDVDITCEPNVVFDLNKLPGEPLPFPDDWFDEIHAYDVLEHFGRQGDARAFLGAFQEFWRVMKPGGYFFATTPHWESSWAWGDPGHTRIISAETLMFLSQRQYAEQVGKTPMTDYRRYYTADFEIGNLNYDEPEVLKFVLIAKKP